MKNNYRKLKFSILLQTVLVTALTVLVGGFILNYVIDGIYNDTFAEMFVEFLMSLNMKEKTAINLYWKLIGNNKYFFIIVGFLLLFALFYYAALSKMMKYVDQIGDGIENILAESTEPIHLITELKPIEIRLNEIKATLKRQELEAEEGEKKKSDLVLFLAHDLKTPLTSIVAYLSMLDSHTEMPEENRIKYTHIALEKSIRLGELINEFSISPGIISRILSWKRWRSTCLLCWSSWRTSCTGFCRRSVWPVRWTWRITWSYTGTRISLPGYLTIYCGMRSHTAMRIRRYG